MITAHNLQGGGFAGPIWLLNPKYRSIEDRIAFPRFLRCPVRLISRSLSPLPRRSRSLSASSGPRHARRGGGLLLHAREPASIWLCLQKFPRLFEDFRAASGSIPRHTQHNPIQPPRADV